MFRLKCPKCGQRMAVPESLVGKKASCPHCGHAAIIPRPGQNAPPKPESAAAGSALADLQKAVTGEAPPAAAAPGEAEAPPPPPQDEAPAPESAVAALEKAAAQPRPAAPATPEPPIAGRKKGKPALTPSAARSAKPKKPPAEAPQETVECPACSAVTPAGAKKCISCGEWLDPRDRQRAERRRRSRARRRERLRAAVAAMDRTVVLLDKVPVLAWAAAFLAVCIWYVYAA
ncbi:MAG TPA: hypothetical protein VFJ30_15430 [Phycisphaerae bacterium]|nr:hypothetical protein [Phycisphaerae bacterium]